MITKADIIKMARHIARRGKGYPDRRIIHPVRDWFIGLALATVCFVGVATTTGYVFWQMSSNGDAAHTAEVAAVRYDHKRVSAALETYRAQEERFRALRGDRTFVPEGSSGTAPADEDGVADEVRLQVQ